MSNDVLKNKLTPGLIVVGLLLWAGLWLRLDSLLAQIFQIDEYISLLAAKMVALRGLPILPSGMFYDNGLPLSFLSGGLIALLGFREDIARWPTLLTGVLTIAVYYQAGRALFSSRLTGLLAATLITCDAMSIYWSGRARMYTMAHFFVLLSVVWLLKSVFQSPNERGRYLFLIFLGLGLVSHTIILLIVPPLAFLALIFSLFYNRDWLFQRRLWLQALVGVLLLGGIMLMVRFGQAASVGGEDAHGTPLAAHSFLSGFLQPGLAWSRFDDLVLFFFDFPYNWFWLLIGFGLVVVIYRFKQKQATFADWAFCFLALYMVLVIFEMGGLLTSMWRKTRYLFILNLPVFLLLSAEGLSRLLRALEQGLFKFGLKPGYYRQVNFAKMLIGVLFLLILTGPLAWEAARAQGTGDYNTAFEFVHDQWQADDKVITVHPSAAYLYLGHNDYYANQSNPRVLADADEPEELIDRYTGSPLIDSVEKLNQVLASHKRVWLVVDQKRLYRRYQPFFTQQIFSQMNQVKQFGGVYVFVSESFPRPLPPDPAAALNAQFDFIRLEGYTLDFNTIAPDNTLPLRLYWRPVKLPARPFKVFVQLRNAQNQNIAQADHFLLEGLLTGQYWQELQDSGDRLRETALLPLPWPLPADQGPYRLFIGLYNPDTFERVPLANDTSGENAVVLPFSPGSP